MRTFLNDFVGTLGFRGSERAHVILQAAKAEKSQLNLIAQKLSSQGIFANLQLVDEQKDSLISAGVIDGAIGDAVSRISDLYSLSNDVSVLLESNSDILSADIRSLNEELNALEKSIANYSFLLSDGGSYDYAFLEPFSDTRNSETFDFFLTDRNGLLFNSDEKAKVISDEGVIALPQEVTRTFPLVGKMIECNVSTLITSANSLANAFDNRTTTGWRMAISSASPVSSTLPSFTKLYPDSTINLAGVNAVLELCLPAPAPCDNIRIVPFSDTPFEIAQIELYPNLNEDSKKTLLDAPVALGTPKSFYFKLQPVSKIKVYIRQGTYRRNGLQPIGSEIIYRRVITPPEPPITVINNPPITYERKTRISFVSRLVEKLIKLGIRVLKTGIRVTNKILTHSQFDIHTPSTLFAPIWGSFRNDDITRAVSSHRQQIIQWRNQTVKNSLLETVAFAKLGIDFLSQFLPKLFIQSRVRDPQINNNNNTVPPTPLQPLPPIYEEITYLTPEQFKYEYNFGVQTIQIGNALNGFKGIFVSKILPSPSDVGEVKLKASDVQCFDNDENKDQPQITSVEYSVSNQAKPDQESDWVSILPTGVDTVAAERLFPDETGRALFRFQASIEDNIMLYKNGYEVVEFNVNQSTITTSNGQTISGLKIPSGFATTTDIFTVDYVPAIDSTIVNFEQSGYEKAPLVSSFDQDGAGEGFSGTAGQLIVDLLYEPYINYSKVDSSIYSMTFGLSPYQPVIVIMNDGTTAANLTNYQQGPQAVLSAGTGYTFLHNGNSLMFNKPVEQSFRVYYQYLPNNLRFRVVMRANATEYVSPKVDFVQVKAKTRKADARRN